jgi:hypothetical protein
MSRGTIASTFASRCATETDGAAEVGVRRPKRKRVYDMVILLVHRERDQSHQRELSAWWSWFPWRGCLDGDAIEQRVERCLIDLDVGCVGPEVVGQSERASVESLVEEAHARAVEEEDLQGRAPLAYEHEQRPATRVVAHALGGEARQAIDAAAKIDGLRCEVHGHAGRDHRSLRSARTARRRRASSTARST